MAEYQEARFNIQCKGRDVREQEVLTEPVEVTVKVYVPAGTDLISSMVDCPHVAGGHGEECLAAGQPARMAPPALCSFSVDLG